MIETQPCQHRWRRLVGLYERGFPHGHAKHDTVYDTTDVFICRDCGHGELRKFSHDCWHPPWEEEWDMGWTWPIAASDLDRLREGLANCPNELDRSCSCAAHLRLRESQDRKPGNAGKAVGIQLNRDGLPEFTTGQGRDK